MPCEPEQQALHVEGLPYLRRVDGCLRRALRLRLPEPFSGPAKVRLEASGDAVDAELEMANGEGTVVGPAACDRPLEVRVRFA